MSHSTQPWALGTSSRRQPRVAHAPPAAAGTLGRGNLGLEPAVERERGLKGAPGLQIILAEDP